MLFNFRIYKFCLSIPLQHFDDKNLMADGVFKMREWKSYSDGLRDFCTFIKDHSGEKVKSVVEVGCYMGEGTCILRQGFPQAVIRCIDPWKTGFDESDPTSFSDMGKVESAFDKAVAPWTHIVKYKGVSSDFLDYPEFKKVHIAYIDGCHTYEAVKNDLETWLPRTKIAIGGHDFGSGLERLKGVERAVVEVVGKPDMVFQDTSWVKLI